MAHIRLAQISSEHVDTTVTLKGWVSTVREQKITFIHIHDGSCQRTFQIVYTPAKDSDQGKSERFPVGTSISATGKIVVSLSKGQPFEMQADTITIIGECQSDFPLQGKKFHSLDYLRSIPEWRGRTGLFRAVARIRDTCIQATHDFFHERGFLNIHTPIITSSDCEGAGETFEVTTGYPEPFFKKPAYLTVSGQLQGEVAACSFGNIYTFGPTFRSEKSKTSRHLSEFWMCEPEMTFISYDDLLSLAEDYIKYCIQRVLEKTDEMTFLSQYRTEHESKTDGDLVEQLKQIIVSPFYRIDYIDALSVLATKSSFSPLTFGDDLPSDQEKWLVSHFGKPVIVTRYPKSLKSFYMRETYGCDQEKKTVDCMDILVPGIGELVGGSMREDSYDVLKQSMVDRKMTIETLQWYLDLRKYGSVPHGGFGLGFERLVLLCTGLKNIRDTIQFPTAFESLF